MLTEVHVSQFSVALTISRDNQFKNEGSLGLTLLEAVVHNQLALLCEPAVRQHTMEGIYKGARSLTSGMRRTWKREKRKG